MRAAVALAALFAASGAHAQELNRVTLAYLQRHGVPCQQVTGVDRPICDYDLVALCDDGRQWALFLIEGEVAFIQPQTGDPYRWRREVYSIYPQIYGSPEISETHPFPGPH